MTQSTQYSDTFFYDDKEITFHFWLASSDSPPDTILFLGAGQTGPISRWVSRTVGAKTVVVDGLPYWHASPNESDIVAFSILYVHSVFDAVGRQFETTLMNVIAESQAAPACILLAQTHIATVKNLVLIRPLGFTVDAFGASQKDRTWSLIRRWLRNSLQLSQTFFHDPRNIGIALIMIQAILRDPNPLAMLKRYQAGVSYNSLKDCRRVATLLHRKGGAFSILLGEKDKLFPPREVAAVLSKRKIMHIRVEVIRGLSHASLAVKASRLILNRALAIARNKKDHA